MKHSWDRALLVIGFLVFLAFAQLLYKCPPPDVGFDP